jgi:hypothetical protein
VYAIKGRSSAKPLVVASREPLVDPTLSPLWAARRAGGVGGFAGWVTKSSRKQTNWG